MKTAVEKKDSGKSNPFDQKVKPAFDDLDDIALSLDSEREKKKSPLKNKNNNLKSN